MNRLLILLVLIQFCSVAYTQSDTLTMLPVVDIREKQFSEIFQGDKVIKFDSLYRIAAMVTNLGDLLSQKGFAFVKSYGQMQLQSISIGGANAGQTAICWEGIPLNDVMLGTADLSLIPFSFFNSVALYQGGTSVLSGGNSLGGAVNLNNELKFRKAIGVKAGVDYSSLNNGAYFLGYDYSEKKIVSHTTFSFFDGMNTIRYIQNGETDILPHANYSGLALMTNNGFKLAKNQILRLDLWYQKYFRNLPPTQYEASSDALQFDEDIRGLLLWKRHGKISETEIKTALFRSFMWYNDSLKFIDSRNATTSLFVQAANSWNFSESRSLFVRGEWHAITVKTNNYLTNKDRNIFAVVAGFKQNLLKDKWKNTISVRFETVDRQISPPVFSYGSRIQILRNFTGKINVSKNYRLPTFNDLYWNPMGNPDLKPENGWSYQGGLSYLFTKDKWLIKFESTGFYNDISDMILWKPQTAFFWSPVNIGKVKTHGAILDLSVLLKKKKWFARIDFDYTYTKAVNNDITDINYGNELLYIPNSQIKLNAFVSYGGFLLKYGQQFVSPVFISVDNEEFLQGYVIADLTLSKKILLRKTPFGLEIYGGVNNLFNESYQVMVSRPMPLRYFKIGLILKINKL